MPQWAGSSWYFLRYMDPHNDEALASKEALEYWSPVDWYNGGMEHTTLHLLYSRFWHKFLYDIGVVPTKEPYMKRTSHGMILGENNEKMSKSRGNVVNPDEVVEEFGADAFRTYEMFIGAFDQSTPWSQQGLKGCYKFLERVWDWKKQYGGRIINQLKKIGSSCDWDRERFTMDEGCSKAVKEVFVNLYNKGLIYQGSRIINWCPHCITALSDAEVEHAEQAGHFWHIKYPIKDSDDYVIIATTRPETLFGDTAVAVNPEDERYKDLVGKMLILPLVGREIPVIADEYVDKEFGTGCVKITPAHDPNDFEVGQRHNLAQIKVMNDDATMNSYAGKYEGMDRYECRKAMIKDLEDEGLLVKVEDHSHNVGQCYRCGTTVELSFQSSGL